MDEYNIPLRRIGRSPEEVERSFAFESKDERARAVAQSLETDPYVDYADVLRVIVKNPPPGGFDENELRKSVMILNSIGYADSGRSGDATPVLRLKPELYQFLQARMAAFRWRLPHENIVKFCDDVRNAERVTLAEEAKG